jgi:toxin ParE1/3/4
MQGMTTNMPDVHISPDAERDLEEIFGVLADSNRNAANKLIRLVYDTAAMLSGYPRMGRDRGNLLSGVLSFPVGNYLIFYRIASDGIEIVRVLHGARDLPAIFRDT